MSALFKKKSSGCCVAVGCSMRKGTNLLSEVKLFKFPRNPERRRRWEIAVRRANWKPTPYSQLCNLHFVTGKPSSDPLHPDFVPSVFDYGKGQISKKNSLARYERNVKRAKTDTSHSQDIPRIKRRLKKNATPSQILPTYNIEREKQIEDERQKRLEDKNGNTPSKVTEEGSKMLGLTEIKVEPSEMVSEKNEFTKTDTETCGGALSDDDDELMNVKLELYEAFTDISNLRKENEMLTKNLSTTEAAQNTLQKSVSEIQKELMITRLKLQQAYREVTALQNAKEELLEKLRDEDIVQNTLEDPDQLHFYTGLNSMKDFTYILSLISSVDGHFRSISLKKQLLIVLTKLKLNLYMKDLAYRFKISATLVGRICDYIIPFLLAKIELLLKCPINAALRRNIPDSVKNTVYENLYQRLVNYTKSKTKQPEEEECGTDFEKMDEKCILN